MWYREAQMNVNIPSDRYPNRDTAYMLEINMEDRRHDRRLQQIIRIYDYEDGIYSVIAYRGNIGGHLAAISYGMFRSRSEALSMALDIKRQHELEGYRDIGVNIRGNDPTVGVISEDYEENNPVRPSIPSAPEVVRDAVFKKQDIDRATSEQLRNALFNPQVSGVIKREIIRSSKMTSEILSDFLFTGHASEIEKILAVQNLNIDSKTLDKIVKQEFAKDSNTAQAAIGSRNLSVNTVNWVLKQGFDNSISTLAYNNPKADLFLKLLWRVKTYPNEDSVSNFETLSSSINDYISKNPFTVDIVKKIIDILSVMGVKSVLSMIKSGFGKFVEDIVEYIFSNSETANYFMVKFPKDFFDEIAMRPEDRAIVDSYYLKNNIENDDQINIMDDVFSQSNNWYKRAEGGET